MNLKDIFFVEVLYKCNLEDSRTINSLSNIISENINLFVFDNSPIRQHESDNFKFKNFTVYYFHDSTNPGLSTAYNSALVECNKLKKKWILLLDQDTTFTKEYIEEIKGINISVLPSSVVAILPRVFSLENRNVIAPTKMSLGGICRPVEINSGIVKSPISGINSGTLLNVSYLNSISGFSMNYSLDMLDHWYYRRIFQDNKNCYLLISSIYQDLSVSGNFEENVSIERYKQMLDAESLFIEEDGLLSLCVFKLRLIFRVLKQIRFKNSEYYKFTLKQVF